MRFNHGLQVERHSEQACCRWELAQAQCRDRRGQDGNLFHRIIPVFENEDSGKPFLLWPATRSTLRLQSHRLLTVRHAVREALKKPGGDARRSRYAAQRLRIAT